MKFCSRCSCEKPAAEFGINAGRKDGLSVYCRPCTKQYMAGKSYDKDRWEQQRARESARSQAYRTGPAAERLKANDRARAKARRAENPSVIRAANAARKAAQRQAIPAWASRSEMAVIYRKAREMSQAFGVAFQVDHVVPLRSRLVCGLHTPANLQLLAEDLNYEKRNFVWPEMPSE